LNVGADINQRHLTYYPYNQPASFTTNGFRVSFGAILSRPLADDKGQTMTAWGRLRKHNKLYDGHQRMMWARGRRPTILREGSDDVSGDNVWSQHLSEMPICTSTRWINQSERN